MRGHNPIENLDFLIGPSSPCHFSLQPASKTVTYKARVRWCNGSTRPFGGFCHGSNPCRTANFPSEAGGNSVYRTDSAQNPAESETQTRKMKFPVIVRHRREKATIYGKSANYAFYRLGYYVAGQRCVRSFKTYGEAKTEAERIVRQLAEGSQAAALSGPQSRDALAAMQRLDALRQSTGRRVSLLAAVSEFAEASAKLQGRNSGEVVEGYDNWYRNARVRRLTNPRRVFERTAWK